MNLYEILQRAWTQAGSIGDRDDKDRTIMTQYVNEGLFELTGGRIPANRPFVVENGSGDIYGIDGFTQALSLVDEAGRSVPFTVSMGRIYAAEGQYTLYYFTAPGLLAQDEDEPQLPERFHGALGDYATWRALSNAGGAHQSLAQVFFARFQLSCVACERWLDGLLGARRIRNKYS